MGAKGQHSRGYTLDAQRGTQKGLSPVMEPNPVSRLAIAIDGLYRRDIVKGDLWPDLHDVERLIIAEVKRIEGGS